MDQTLTAGSPGNLFEGSYVSHSIPLGLEYYDISPSQHRLLMTKEEELAECKIYIAQHWFEELRERVAVQ